MPAPRSQNTAKVHTVWYSYRGIWLDDEPEDEHATERERKKLVRDRKVEVQIFVHKRTDDSESKTPPYPIREIHFEMRAVDQDEKKIASFEGPDIEALRRAIWETLDKRFAVKWTPYFLVQVEMRPPFTAQGQSVEFNYDTVYKGVAHDGTLLLKKHEWRGDMKIEPWPGEFSTKGGKTIACIEGTDENRAALEEFEKRFREVGKALSKVLEPKNIMRTLAALAGTKALPLNTNTK